MTSLTIGRNPESGIVVSETFPRVSNNHATIEMVDGHLVYIDHSSNGTMINGNIIRHEQVVLTDGDRILLAGEYLLAWPVLLNFFPDLQRHTLRSEINPVAIPADAPFPAGQASVPRNIPATPEKIPAGQDTRQWMPAVGAGRLNSLTQSDIDEYLGRFNLGAFLGSWVWGLANRIYWPLAIIPLSFIPYLGQILSLFLCTYLGLNGNQMGWQHSRGVSFPEWRKRQAMLVYIGVLVFIVCMVVQLAAFTRITNMF